jgi:hypothetical protein
MATKPDPGAGRAYAIIAAAARDLNDELTVILNGIAHAAAELDADDVMQARLAEAQDAAGRCARMAEMLIRFVARHGARSTTASLKGLLG